MSILSLPPDLLRVIVMKVEFEDSVEFQKSSSLDLAATSYVSFYYSYFEKHYDYSVIDKLYLHRGEVINQKSVAERQFRSNCIFAEFFCYNASNKLKRYEQYFEPSKEFELERLGYEIGDVFASASNDVWTPSVLTKIASLRETVSKLRHGNPGLVKAKQQRFFEDLFFAGCRYCNRFVVEGISDSNDLPPWLQCLAFAEKMNYTALQHDLADQIIDGVFCVVASGLMDYERGMKLLLRLFPKLLHWKSVDRVCRHLADAPPETLPGLLKLYLLLLNEVVGKKKFNYDVLYENFLFEMICSLSEKIGFLDTIEPYLIVVKSCLNWRFKVPSDQWDFDN